MRRFQVGDHVTLHGCVFWLTVDEFLPHGFVRCHFGKIGCDAGPGIHESQLTLIEQRETQNA